MEELITQYVAAQQLVIDLHKQLLSQHDGFEYVCRIREYGHVSVEVHNNTFTVQELCMGFNGDNGIVDVYTDNPNSGIYTEGGVIVTDKADLHKYKKSRWS